MIRKRKGVQPLRCTTEQNLLGEGARWDARRDELLRVDILAGRVYRDQLDDDGALFPSASTRCPAPSEPSPRSRVTRVGCLLRARIRAPLARRYAAHDRGRRLPREHAHERRRVRPARSPVGGHAGRRPPHGRWRVVPARHHRTDRPVLTDLTISNGLGWSTDGGTMYFVDSGPQIIYAFDFDGDDGTISDRRTLVTVDPETGSPDGLTVDSEGDSGWPSSAVVECGDTPPTGRSVTS